MQVNDLSSIDPNVDYTQSCESRLMEFEYKLQEVEASLLILESQLDSIPHLDQNVEVLEEKNIELNLTTVEDKKDEETLEKKVEIDLSSDPRYQKFFKMLQVGVPPAAVKLKMQSEGVNPNILDAPHSIQP